MCVVAANASGQTPDVPARPNIVLIVADDLGYSDLGCYGGEIATPNLDKIAANGLRLTRFFNGGMCVTTRTSMITGKWWPEATRTFDHRDTLPERLQATGYPTALIGKWHLPGHPMDHGFDHFFGFLNGFADHFAGSNQYQLDRQPFTEFGPNYYSSDGLTDRAIEFVEQSDSDSPLMLMMSYQAPHNPLQAPASEIKKYRGKYLAGWQAIRNQRFNRQKELGIVDKNSTLPPYPENLPRWNDLTDRQRELEDLRMAVYAAMVDRMDQGIGRLIQSLEDKQILDNTLILFISDNGTDSFSVVDQAMLTQNKLPGDRASNYQPGTGWAYASVTPWRLYKISQHGGGVTSGAILSWPGHVSDPGGIRSSAVHVIDILPTMMQAAGRSSGPIQGTDGQSFVELLRDPTWQRIGPLYFQYMDNRAIRTRDWTLAEVDGSGWELFQARTDPIETKDVSADHPEIVQRLASEWLDWWKKSNQTNSYQPTSTRTGPHYAPQGDRGSGRAYVPSSMPKG